MKVVLDTNIVMSGIFWAGHARDIIVLLESEKFSHFCSKSIAKEYVETADKLKKKLKKADHNLLDEILDIIFMKSFFVEAIGFKELLCRDPNDQMFLDLAICVGAHYIVSGDKDLLVLEKYPGGEIIKPVPFLNLFS